MQMCDVSQASFGPFGERSRKCSVQIAPRDSA